mgnify:CR=1 FL=1
MNGRTILLYFNIYLSIIYYILKVHETSYKRSHAATWRSNKIEKILEILRKKTKYLSLDFHFN